MAKKMKMENMSDGKVADFSERFTVGSGGKKQMGVGAFFGLTLVWEVIVYLLIFTVIILIGDKQYTRAQGVVTLCAFFLCMAAIPAYLYAKNR